jgi:carbonic anhydrase
MGTVAAVEGAKPVTSTRRAAAGMADALLLNCIDYRLNGDVTDFMASQGLKHKYDQLILAGASLGALTDAYPEWNTTFWQHLDLAIQLHGIHQVIAIDHRDCGAYKLVLGQDLAADPDLETQVHAQWLHKLRDGVADRYPDLHTSLYLMALDGSVESIK